MQFWGEYHKEIVSMKITHTMEVAVLSLGSNLITPQAPYLWGICSRAVCVVLDDLASRCHSFSWHKPLGVSVSGGIEFGLNLIGWPSQVRASQIGLLLGKREIHSTTEVELASPRSVLPRPAEMVPFRSCCRVGGWPNFCSQLWPFNQGWNF